MPEIDWDQVLGFTLSPLELFIRGTLTYFFLFAMFRFVLRRDTGTLGPSDLLVLVKDGVKQDAALRRELISEGELQEMLREHEIENLAEVKRAYLEPDGQMTVIRRRSGERSSRASKRHHAL